MLSGSQGDSPSISLDVLVDKPANLFHALSGLREEGSHQGVTMEHLLPYPQGDIHARSLNFFRKIIPFLLIFQGIPFFYGLYLPLQR